jgi:hypothetical protein
VPRPAACMDAWSWPWPGGAPGPGGGGGAGGAGGGGGGGGPPCTLPRAMIAATRGAWAHGDGAKTASGQ